MLEITLKGIELRHLPKGTSSLWKVYIYTRYRKRIIKWESSLEEGGKETSHTGDNGKRPFKV